MKRFACTLLVLVLIVACFVEASATVFPKFPESKMTPLLISALDEIDEDDHLSVYIFLNDIDSEHVMDLFNQESPEEASEYSKAQKDEYDSVNGEMLQKGIEIKRRIFREEYSSYNESFVSKHMQDCSVLFISHYSPLIIANISKSSAFRLEKNESVSWLDLYIEYQPEDLLANANAISKADYVRDTLNNKGSGVKIGQIENGVPKTTESDLPQSQIHRFNGGIRTDHATNVAQILIGTSNGIAPLADLYSIGLSCGRSFYYCVEWLLSQGVNVINMSNGLNFNGEYDVACKWVDHIAIQHDVHFVTAAGNTRGSSDYDRPGMVSSPGMAYNAITVGAYNDKNTLPKTNDELCSFSSYLEYASSNRPEKPNLVAPGYDISFESGSSGVSGTSFAAPQVAGVIAQLCSYKPSLKVLQTKVGAMFAAGSCFKIEGTNGSGTIGDSFKNQGDIRITSQIGNREGAGILMARETRRIEYKGKAWKATISSSEFPYTTTYNATSSNTMTRVAIFWVKQNSLNGSTHVSTNVTEESFSNLNLTVIAPNGTVVGSSSSLYANFEIVQFNPSQYGYGTYTIKISKVGSGGPSTEKVGIAVWDPASLP